MAPSSSERIPPRYARSLLDSPPAPFVARPAINGREFVDTLPDHVLPLDYGNFSAFAPQVPYTNSGPHGMLVDTFVNPIDHRINRDPYEISDEEMTMVAATLLAHSSNASNNLAGYNVGWHNAARFREGLTKAQTSRSQPPFHPHFYSIDPEVLERRFTLTELYEHNEQLPEPNKSFNRNRMLVSGRTVELIGSVFVPIIDKQLKQQGSRIKRDERVGIRGSNIFPYVPGTMNFNIPEGCSPQELAQFLKLYDRTYRNIHRRLFGSVINNYEELAFNHFLGEPHFKTPDNIKAPFRNLLTDEQSERLKRRLQTLVRAAQEKPEKNVILGPSYSLVVADNTLTVSTHFYGRTLGNAESAGIHLIRRTDPTLTPRYEEQIEAARNLMTGLHTQITSQYPDIIPPKGTIYPSHTKVRVPQNQQPHRGFILLNND